MIIIIMWRSFGFASLTQSLITKNEVYWVGWVERCGFDFIFKKMVNLVAFMQDKSHVLWGNLSALRWVYGDDM